ncbi:hypothetical protein AYO44_02925 [Planctomycetaceae bacterium SCGC AG-212-F19]|nr:hypothetical protein AYO44_02925 [Planctomycetaceae bacterium SCGC AG-212-F19]
MPPPRSFLDEVDLRIPDFGPPKYPARMVETSEAVAEYLKNGKQLLGRFAQLELAIDTELKIRLKGLRLAYPGINPYQRAKDQVAGKAVDAPPLPKSQQNILTTLLTRNELNNGFQVDPAVGSDGSPVAVFVGFIKPDIFRRILQAGYPFRDPMVPGGHGEFTHRIQWYLISSPGGLRNDRGGKWGDFYRWLGGVKHTQTFRDPENPDQAKEATWLEFGLWDALCDRNAVGSEWVNGPYNTAEVTDFRSPENLHKFIVENLATICPLLSGFIKSREEAWLPQRGNKPNLIRNYVAKVLYSRQGANVTADEWAEVDRIIANVGVVLPAGNAQW